MKNLLLLSVVSVVLFGCEQSATTPNQNRTDENGTTTTTVTTPGRTNSTTTITTPNGATAVRINGPTGTPSVRIEQR